MEKPWKNYGKNMGFDSMTWLNCFLWRFLGCKDQKIGQFMSICRLPSDVLTICNSNIFLRVVLGIQRAKLCVWDLEVCWLVW